jgi:hypothetical protein
LADVESIACGAKAELFEINMLAFVVLDGADLVDNFVSKLGVGRGNTEVIDLAAEENLVVLVGHLVDVALMGG